MTIQAGLVGLPNVGKSTLFNALTKSSVPAENYPFCTIEPHVAITHVPDPRLDKLEKLYGSKKQIPATVQFVDIAGLVKGAAAGEGLGNQFLNNIREVDLILHVLRCFIDHSGASSNTRVTALEDFDTIAAELMLKDLESVEKRITKIGSLMRGVQSKPDEKKKLETELVLLQELTKAMNATDLEKVRALVTACEVETVPLLSAKKFLIIANIAEDEIEGDAYKNNAAYQALIQRFGAAHVIPISAKVEQELSQLDEAERTDMMSMLGIKEQGLDAVIRETYKHLGLITFFTCGPQEAHAWPIKKGLTVRQAGGEIHSDLERGFICADVFNCNDLFTCGTIVALKDQGKVRTEGQGYVMQDGDIINIKFNV